MDRLTWILRISITQKGPIIENLYRNYKRAPTQNPFPWFPKLITNSHFVGRFYASRFKCKRQRESHLQNASHSYESRKFLNWINHRKKSACRYRKSPIFRRASIHAGALLWPLLFQQIQFSHLSERPLARANSPPLCSGLLWRF